MWASILLVHIFSGNINYQETEYYADFGHLNIFSLAMAMAMGWFIF